VKRYVALSANRFSEWWGNVSQSEYPFFAAVKYLALIAALGVAAWVRLADLGYAPFKADEINQFMVVARGQSVSDIWRNPPWMNQIPTAETLAILSSHLIPGEPSEMSIRLPFALFGLATVLICAVWVGKRWGIGSAFILLLWMGLSPFHVYETREAYYYVLLMFFSAGSVFSCLRVVGARADDVAYPLRPYIIWVIWCLAACHMHMSFWSFALVQWVFLFVKGWARNVSGRSVRPLILQMVIAALLIGLIMSRWIYRALQEVLSVGERGGHIGYDVFWTMLNLLPTFMAGINIVGYGVLALVIVMAVWVGIPLSRSSAAFRSLTQLSLSGLVVAYLYVGIIGAGAAKFTYFSAFYPPIMVWCSILLAHAAGQLSLRIRFAGHIALLLFVLFLSVPTGLAVTRIMRLDGKPTPYKQIIEVLDQRLQPGSVVVIDRWFESWVEMAVHAPSRSFITFTVPDEPYEAYVQNRWREVTRNYIEAGRAQAFLMVTQNYADREGIWAWPASYFARHTQIRNEPGLWLREHGFVPVGDFYSASTNRLIVDLFYDLPEDQVGRARKEGRDAIVLYGSEWGYAKPWRQTGNFLADYRVLSASASLHAYNLTDQHRPFMLTIRAAALPEEMAVRIGDRQVVRFPGQQLGTQQIAVNLAPGENVINLAMIRPRPGAVLYVEQVQLRIND
jgi:uncharacterized membrane protein